MNFIPKMNSEVLVEGYKRIIRHIYNTKSYYSRVRKLLIHYHPQRRKQVNVDIPLLRAFLRSVIIIGIMNKGRREYWKLIFWTLFRRPGSIIDAVTFTVFGYHFQTVYGIRS